ncbi:MAG: hypothetical protein ACOC2W_01565 [bacterium]
MKDFKKDFLKIFNLLKSKKRFSFSKYADGEYAILRNKKITNCDNWTFDPNKHQKYRNELLNSFKFHDDEYYVGISCPCCVPQEHVNWMRDNVSVNDNHLTWANIFVNNNYNDFKKYFIPEFNNHDVVLVATEKGDATKLPFGIEEHIKITGTAWLDNFNLIEELPKRNDRDKLYLFSAGPLGNMLAAKMWEQNKNNIYMDIGSTINPWLVGNNRGFLRGANTLNKMCIW